MSDTARVLFPVDANSAVAALHSVYQGRGQVSCLIVSKRDMPHQLDGEAALQVVEAGAAHIEGAAADADVRLVAIGASQLDAALKAARPLPGPGVRPLVPRLIDPGGVRAARDPVHRPVP